MKNVALTEETSTESRDGPRQHEVLKDIKVMCSNDNLVNFRRTAPAWTTHRSCSSTPTCCWSTGRTGGSSTALRHTQGHSRLGPLCLIFSIYIHDVSGADVQGPVQGPHGARGEGH